MVRTIVERGHTSGVVSAAACFAAGVGLSSLFSDGKGRRQKMIQTEPLDIPTMRLRSGQFNKENNNNEITAQ